MKAFLQGCINNTAARYTVSNVVLSAAGFIGSFVAARILEPAQLGSVQTAMLLIPYLVFLGLAIPNGLNRQYPLLHGQGNEEEAACCACACHSFLKVAALVAALCGLGQFVFYLVTTSNRELQIASGGVIFILALGYLPIVPRTIVIGRQEFGELSKVNAGLSVVGLVMLGGVWLLGVAGQCLRLMASPVYEWLSLRRRCGDDIRWRWDPRRLRELSGIGLPIFTIGYMQAVFAVADRTLVAAVRGPEAVGHYALAGLVVAAVHAFVVPIATMTYTKGAREYGRTGTVSSLKPLVWKLVGIYTITIVPVAVVIYFLLPVVVPLVLPKYVPGVRAAQIALIGAVAVAYTGPMFVCNVIRRNWPWGVSMFLALAGFWLAASLMEREAITLERVAMLRSLTACGLAVVVNVIIVFIFAAAKDERGREDAS